MTDFWMIIAMIAVTYCSYKVGEVRGIMSACETLAEQLEYLAALELDEECEDGSEEI